MTELYNDDCFKVLDYLIKEKIKVDMVLTDPPYNLTANKWETEIDLILFWEKVNKIKNINTPVLVFGIEPFSSKVRMSNIKNFKYDWIWKKPQGTNFLLAKKQPLRIYENISVFYNKQSLYKPIKTKGKPYKTIHKTGDAGNNYGSNNKKYIRADKGERYPINILKYKRDKEKLHPTQKPVELLEYLIKTYTNENDLVLDCFMGSGSTGVASKKQNRNFIGIELDENYFKIAEKRINDTIL